MSSAVFFACVGAVILVLGIARVAAARDWVVRLLALNVASGGALVVLVSLAQQDDGTDPVPHALALTGIVIMVAVTGVGLVLARIIGAAKPEWADGARGTPTDEQDEDAA